jgi:hypothetical protein
MSSPAVSIEEGLRRNREVYAKLTAKKASPVTVDEGGTPPAPPPPLLSSLPTEKEVVRIQDPPPHSGSPSLADRADAPTADSIRFDPPEVLAYPSLRENEPVERKDPAAAFLARLGREERLRPQSMEVR